MAGLSTVGRLFLALLLVLWQPLCLCHGSDGGHGHDGEESHALLPDHHHDGEASHSALSDHHHDADESDARDAHHGEADDHGQGGPCDHEPGGCDCSKAFASSRISSDGMRGPLHHLALLSFLPHRHAFVQCPADGPTIRGVDLQDRSPPPLLTLYCVLRI